MNKTDLARELSQTVGISQKAALDYTNAMLDILVRSLNKKEPIKFIGFGSFRVKLVSKRIARNPHTNEIIEIPEHYRTVFKASTKLLEHLNAAALKS
ncbi:MAG: HU family DNA-binding protein [Firmicutes bacterium]|nr:HU family DNA-binding protein [Bacillota bacterium]